MKYLKLLYVQVLIGIALGIAAGHFLPGYTSTYKIVSDTFINMIKMVIAPIIFVTIVLGVSGVGDLKKVGRVGGKGLLYFEIVTTLALIIGLVVANVVRPGDGVDTSKIDASTITQYTDKAKDLNWGEFFSHIVPSNIFKAFAEGDILQILFFSVLFGIAVTRMGNTGESLIRMFDKISKALFHLMKIIMKLAPLGAFAGMAFTIGKFGLGTLLVYIKNELLIVLGTSSSESALPNIMEKLELAGCRKSVVGLIIPTGYSFNLDGTTIYLSMAVIFLAQVFNVPLSLGQQLTIIGVLMLTSKGAAAVTGGGFIVLASTLSALHVIPLEGLALLIGVDRFMSEARSITNLIGNTVATVVISKSEGEIDMEVYRRVVG